VVPRLSGARCSFSMASLGLPGIGDFVGEFLVLLGSYKVSIPITVVASIGILASTFYALRMVQRAFQGPNTHAWLLPILTPREGRDGGGDDRGPALAWVLSPAGARTPFQPALQNLQHRGVSHVRRGVEEIRA
jgi:hypothetical protein